VVRAFDYGKTIFQTMKLNFYTSNWRTCCIWDIS